MRARTQKIYQKNEKTASGGFLNIVLYFVPFVRLSECQMILDFIKSLYDLWAYNIDSYLNTKCLGFQIELFHDQLPLAVPCYDLLFVIEFTVGLHTQDFGYSQLP